MLRRLRRKFILVMMLLVTGMLALVFGVMYYFTQLHLETESLSTLQTLCSKPLIPGQVCPTESYLPYIQIQLDHQGQVLEAAGSLNLGDRGNLQRLADAAAAQKKQSGELEVEGLRYFFLRSAMGVRLSLVDITSERLALSHLAQSCLLLGLLSFAAFFLLSLVLARWMVKPVETAWRQQRQFVADASHELKTPLTVILTNAELLESGGEASTKNLLTMARQMRVLVERLLVLAQTEGEDQPPLVPLDFSQLVEEAVLPFEVLLFEAGLTLESQLEEGLMVKGRREQLGHIVPIFLDNARKYAARERPVLVSLARTGRQRCRLVVESAGDPIPPQELENIFKRFYRLDKARSRDGSFGLGLSIAAEIVQDHRGRIWAESGAFGNRFLVELPCR